ncbi:uncharacterized protein LOC124656211 [Lolium rigidum]|uniref:uncharacterized protein LOC124656211 n=1 Tax=Lolium rigidum TaxID=89674 RepID=UPI001F5DA8F8|nr:uncharacterized protein LOC124656211 [Lolium rigidum]
MARGLRSQAREARELHIKGQHEEALARALEVLGANPGSALALNLVGSLHRHFGSAAWRARASDDDEAASTLELHHHQLALDAFSAAARIAPNCVMTAICHAEALAACSRIPDGQVELLRVCSMPEANHMDPAVHHVGYDLVLDASTAKKRKSDALCKANLIMQDFEAMINDKVVPEEATELLAGDAASAEVRRRANLFSQRYPYSARAQLLLVYVELEHVRTIDLAADRQRRLWPILAVISEAAVVFDRSLLVALFHAKVLFALDEFDEAERECRRALRVEEPSDPNLDDIPPAISVPGADYESRVSSVEKQLRILLKRVIVVAALCWSSIESTQQGDRVDRVISLKAATLQEHYNRIDPSAAKTISDTLRFLKNQTSWSFLVCPNSSCHGKRFLGIESLWKHMRKQHRDGLWNKLEAVLGSHLYENTSNDDDDHPFDAITLSKDSQQHDIFHLPTVQPMFRSLLLSPSIGIQAEPLAEMRQRKCREGAEIIADIKKKLRMLPKDELNTEYEELCFAIKDLWLKFLKTSALDHREAILPLARSFQWIQMKISIALSAKDLGRFIGGANIDITFGKVPAAPDRNVSVVHGSEPSHANNIDNPSGDNLQTENLQPLCSDETLKDGEKCEESEIHVVNSNSETMVDQRSMDPPIDVHESGLNVLASDETLKDSEKCEESEIHVVDSKSETMVDQRSMDPPIDVHESGLNVLARIAELELEKEDWSKKANCSYNNDGEKSNVLSQKNLSPIIPHDTFHSHPRFIPLEGCSSSYAAQLHMERWAAAMELHGDPDVSSGTSGQSVEEMADKDLSILSVVIQSLCNLRHFRDNFLTEPLVWIMSADNVCIALQFYEIFTSWEKNDYHLTDVILTYMKTLLCGVDHTIFPEKVGINFASEILATILIGLHMSETCSRFSLNKETEKHVVNPITCGDCMCPTHNIFGIKFNAQMSCECGKCYCEYPYTALFHKLDAGSPQTTKIKSFAELRVLLDEQFCKDNNCKDCGNMLNTDLLLSNTPHFFTIVLNWLSSSESPDILSEFLAGITSPVDTGFFCKSADPSTMYTVTSMGILYGVFTNREDQVVISLSLKQGLWNKMEHGNK